MIENSNLPELISNTNENQSKTRTRKLNPKMKQYDEDARRNLKISRLKILEEDEEFHKEDKEDSDYDMNDEDNAEKKKRPRKLMTKAAREIRFGKINVNKYFTSEKVNKENENIFPNYNNITLKSKPGGTLAYKICNVCFAFANYTCPRCSDRFCSKDCFKTHKEIKCVKYLEL